MAIDEFVRTILSFGPRAVGTPAERATAHYIAGQFARMGLSVSRQEFLASPVPLAVVTRVLPVISIVVLGLVSQIFFSHPLAAMILLLIPPGLMSLGMRMGFGVLKRWIAARHLLTTENIVGQTSSAGADGPTLILMGHYDSKSQTQPMVVRMLSAMLSLVIYAVLVILALLTLLGVPIPSLLIMVLIVVAVVCHVAYLTNTSGNRSPGAIDNASGVGVVMDLASKLPERLRDRVRLMFVASGAEELGLMGAAAFVETNRDQLNREGALVINLDSLGAGGKVLLVTSGRMPDPRLGDLARRAFVSRGFAFGAFSFMVGAGMDHMPLSRAGFSALSFTQGALRAGRRIHTSRDSLEALRMDELRLISETIREFVEAIYAEEILTTKTPRHEEEKGLIKNESGRTDHG